MGHASGSKLSAKNSFDSDSDQRPSCGEAIRDGADDSAPRHYRCSHL